MKTTLLFLFALAAVGTLSHAASVNYARVSGSSQVPADTCTGSGCAVGLNGISTDGGVIIRGKLPGPFLGSTGSVFNEGYYGSAPSDTSGLCLSIVPNIDGGELCMAPINFAGGSRQLTIGTSAVTPPTLADGGAYGPAMLQFTLDGRDAGAFSGIANFSTGTNPGQGLMVNFLAVPVFHGGSTAQQAFECNNSDFSAGTRAITFATAFSVAPNCWCNAAGGSAGAPAGCSTDVPTTSGMNVFGVGTATFRWCCVGAR